MRAAVLRQRRMVVDDVPDPVPGPGQLLVRTLACGICGSDLHAVTHGDQLVALTEEAIAVAPPDEPLVPQVMDLAADVVMGHEFAAEVIELGPDCTQRSVGETVVSMPVMFDADGGYAVGYANRYPGGYGELMVLSDLLALPVPNGLDARRAALTEPMAVGVHAVARSRSRPATRRSCSAADRSAWP